MSASPETAPETSTEPPPPPRFRWPMRVLLSLFVFDMVFRSFSVLLPQEEWREKFDLWRYPHRRLPTRAELAELAARPVDPGELYPIPERLAESADSVWEFLKPWPTETGRRAITGLPEAGAFALCWLDSRLGFVENLFNTNQDWQMFSPNVSRRRYLTRARLIYPDGSKWIVRQTADPRDLTAYGHWFEEKILDYELAASDDDADACRGYCNLLKHRHTDEAGAPVRIELFWVRYDYAPPGVDPAAHYREQTGPPESQVGPVFYVYDAAAGTGRMVK